MVHVINIALRHRPAVWARRAALLLGLSCFNALAVPQDVVLVFDNSGSMRKEDPGFLARTAAHEFLQSLDGDRRVGVLVFDDKVSQTAALDQPEARTGALGRADYKGRYSNSPAAVERALYELKTNGRANASKVIVFMSDGPVDTGNPDLDADRTRWLREELGKDAAASKVRIFGIAFTEAADIQLMEALTEATGGSFERAYTPQELAAAFGRLRVAIDAAPAADAAASLTPEERASLEQMSRETGVPMAQLLRELAAGEKAPPQALANGVQVASASTAPAAPPAAAVGPPPESGGTGLLAMGVVGAIVLVGGWLVLRRRPGKAAPATVASTAKTSSAVQRAAESAQVPEAWLLDTDGHAAQPPRRLTAKPLMVGRVGGDDVDQLDYYAVDKPTIGRRHAVIKCRDSAFWIVDQGSVNGTFVNGQRVAGERRLRNGDHIKFHHYEFEFQLPGGSSSEATMVGVGNDKTLVASLDSTLVAGSAAALATVAVAASKGAPVRADATVVSAAPAPQAALGSAPAGGADDMFDEVLPAATPPGMSVQEAELLDATAPPAAGDLLDDLLGETVQRPQGASDPQTPLDGLAETALRPDALGDTFFRDEHSELDADATGFFDDMTMRPAGAAAAELLEADLDVLDITSPRAGRVEDDAAPSKDFYTATTIIPSAVLPEEPVERTLVFKAPPVPAAPELAPTLPPPAPAAIEAADDFFMLEPPPPAAAPDDGFADFDLPDPVIELPVEPEPEATPRRVYTLDVTHELSHFEGDDEPPLSEKTIVLPTSPLIRGKRPPE